MIENLFSTPIYVARVDNFDKIQQEINHLRNSLNESFGSMSKDIARDFSSSFGNMTKEIAKDMTGALTKVDEKGGLLEVEIIS